MLSDYQYAILAQMGITVFVDQNETTHASQPKDSAHAQHEGKQNTQSLEDAKAKITQLRASLGTTPQASIQNIKNKDSQAVKDIQSWCEWASKSVVPVSQWQLSAESAVTVSTEKVVLNGEPDAMTPEQKRALWQALLRF